MSTPATPTATIDPAVYARRWRILVVLCLSLMVIMVANGSLNVALPSLADDLHASTSSLQWMVDAYGLVFAGMLFTAGTIGDRFGRRRALQGGLMLFLVASIGAALSDTTTQVIAARAVMGFAAAFVMPSTLSLLANVFPAHERGKAISIWAGIAAGGAALGPATSGFLVEHFWWGSVFLVNVPLLIVAIVAGRLLLPESRDPGEQRVDVPGAGLSILAIGALVYAIIEAPAHGWASGETLATFALAVVALAGFAWRELHTPEPMLDLRLLRDLRFSVASGGIMLCFFAMFGTMFLLTQYLQLVLSYSPFHAGLLLLPMSLVMMIFAPQAPRMVARFGISRVVPVGMGLMAAGLVVLSFMTPNSHGWVVYFAMLPIMVGMSSTMSPFTTLIMSSVPPERAGVGSATNDTTRELGGALGVAVLGSVVTTRFTGHIADSLGGLTATDQATVRTGLAGALQVAGRVSGDAGQQLATAARAAFTDGLGVAALVAAGVVVVTAAVSTTFLRRMSSVPRSVPVDALALAEIDTIPT